MRNPWESDGECPGQSEDETWRGDQHQEDWPENLAGPEYWLNKKALDRPNYWNPKIMPGDSFETRYDKMHGPCPEPGMVRGRRGWRRLGEYDG